MDVHQFMSESAIALQAGGFALARRIRVWGKRSLASQFSVLPEAAAGMDAMFAAGTILAAASAAELHGIPYRFVAYVPSLLPSAEHAPALLPFQPRRPLARRALWWCTHALLAVALRPDLNRARRALGLAPARDVLRHVLSPRPVLALDRPIASVPADCAMPVAQIPCLHPRGGPPLPEKLDRFLAAGPAPVFVGFGSMPDTDPAATTQRLLDAIDALGCRALISHGWAGLAEVALPSTLTAVGDVSHAAPVPTRGRGGASRRRGHHAQRGALGRRPGSGPAPAGPVLLRAPRPRARRRAARRPAQEPHGGAALR